MQITCWTSYKKAEKKKYIDPSNERIYLMNKDKVYITPNELQKLAEEQNISTDEAYKKWKTEFDKIPFFTDEKKAEELGNLWKEMEQCVIEHCKIKGIRFNSNYHQDGDYGVPIIDDKYMFFCTLREWGYVMAMADEIDDEMGYLKYYLYSKNNPIKYPNEVNGEICV